MDQHEFYKDQYHRTLERKNEINGSLSTPIGILSALGAGLLYAASNFNYDHHFWLSAIFASVAAISFWLLMRSIYHLVKALSDLHDGYEYAYLADTDELALYHNQLVAFYGNQGSLTLAQAQQQADTEFEQ